LNNAKYQLHNTPLQRPGAEHGEVIGGRLFPRSGAEDRSAARFLWEDIRNEADRCILDHAVILKCRPHAAKRRQPTRMFEWILDNRLTPVDQNPVAFIVRNIGRVVERAKDNGATITMEPLVAVRVTATSSRNFSILQATASS